MTIQYYKTAMFVAAVVAIVAAVVAITRHEAQQDMAIANLEAKSNDQDHSIVNLTAKTNDQDHSIVNLTAKTNDQDQSIVNLNAKTDDQDRAIASFKTKANDPGEKEITVEPDLKFPLPVDSVYFPTGWMGDGEQGEEFMTLKRSAADDGKGAAWEISAKRGPVGWLGIYWQYPEQNWGKVPGRNLTGARGLQFECKGAKGGEIVKFEAGGIGDLEHKDSFEASLGDKTLSQDWEKFTIDLSTSDLSNVIGAFAWSASSADNGDEYKFFIRNLEFF